MRARLVWGNEHDKILNEMEAQSKDTEIRDFGEKVGVERVRIHIPGPATGGSANKNTSEIAN